MWIRTTVVLAAAFLFAVAQAQQPPSIDFSPVETVLRQELREANTPGGAVAIVMGDRLVYARGEIDLNKPVGSYVKGLDLKVAQVTAHQLQSHTAGFFDEAPMFGSSDETALEKEVRSWNGS